jgi:sugar-specific transcriptional regulator TrmB
MKDAIHELIGIGLTEYDSRVYYVLLQQSPLCAKEIAKIGGIPRTRVYDILDNLVQKGFCIPIPGTVKAFRAVNPEVAIKNLIELRRKEEDEMHEKMVVTATSLRELYDNQEDNTSPLDYIQIYTSKSSQLEKAFELANNTQHIHRSFNKAPYATANLFDKPSKVTTHVAEQVERGVIVRAIWEIDEENLENFVNHINLFVQQGEEARISEKLPLKLMITDDRTAMFTMQNRGVLKNDLTSMVVEHTDLTGALIELFEIHWEKSMTFDEFVAERNLQEVIKCCAAT